MAAVRYIVDDVDAAVGFYTERLGFEVEMHPGPGFAALRRGGKQILVEDPWATASSCSNRIATRPARTSR